MDPSHICMLEVNLPKSFFETYDLEVFSAKDLPVKFRLMLETFLRVVTRPKKDQSIELVSEQVDGHLLKLNFKLNGRTGTIPLLEASTEEVPTPKIPFDATVTIVSNEFRDVIKDSSEVTDNVRISVEDQDHSQSFTVSAFGELSNINTRYERSDEEIIDLEMSKEFRSTYNCNYLREFTRALAAVAEIIKFKFSKNMPCKIEAQGVGEDVVIDYYLAPRIEEEDTAPTPNVPESSTGEVPGTTEEKPPVEVPAIANQPIRGQSPEAIVEDEITGKEEERDTEGISQPAPSTRDIPDGLTRTQAVKEAGNLETPAVAISTSEPSSSPRDTTGEIPESSPPAPIELPSQPIRGQDGVVEEALPEGSGVERNPVVETVGSISGSYPVEQYEVQSQLDAQSFSGPPEIKPPEPSEHVHEEMSFEGGDEPFDERGTTELPPTVHDAGSTASQGETVVTQSTGELVTQPEALLDLTWSFESEPFHKGEAEIHAVVTDDHDNWLLFTKVHSLQEAIEEAKQASNFNSENNLYVYRVVEEVRIDKSNKTVTRRYL